MALPEAEARRLRDFQLGQPVQSSLIPAAHTDEEAGWGRRHLIMLSLASEISYLGEIITRTETTETPERIIAQETSDILQAVQSGNEDFISGVQAEYSLLRRDAPHTAELVSMHLNTARKRLLRDSTETPPPQ